MTELADLLPKPGDGVTVRRARVIDVQGSSLYVDMGGGITIARLDTCNPIPGQQVYIISEGSSMTAVAAIGGPWRQSTITVTDVSTTDVRGLINGVSTVIPKMGEFTPAVGDVLPLVWSADGGAVWAGGKPGLEYVPPAPTTPPSSGGGGTGGTTVTTGTSSYPATWAGKYNAGGSGWISGNLYSSFDANGFFYGASRFRELQGRTITGFRVNLVRVSGSGAAEVYGNGQAGPSGMPPLSYNAGSVNPGGWVSLPIGLASFMIAGTGTGALILMGSFGQVAGLPYGTLQFDWRK